MAQEIEKRNSQELEAKEKDLAEKVANATLEQLQAKVAADMEILKMHLPSKEKEAHEAALDVQYLRTRQQRLSKNRTQKIFKGLAESCSCYHID